MKQGDAAAIYAANNSLRLHPAQEKLIEVRWNDM